jgi:hypothetical protein
MVLNKFEPFDTKLTIILTLKMTKLTINQEIHSGTIERGENEVVYSYYLLFGSYDLVSKLDWAVMPLGS